MTDSVDGTTEYTYDALGQLLRETAPHFVNTMTYDNYGNIVSKNGKAYTYGDGAWKDLLTEYDGQTITYDAQGNPTSYLGHTLTWEKGRQLRSFDNITYTYNANGIRTSKTVDGIRHDFVLDGVKILRETWNGNTIVPIYDNEDSVCGIIYNGAPYYFVKNLQGDVIAIVDKDAVTVAKYAYDAWGVCLITQDTSGCSIASVNPFRYRGYYYDGEIGLYYLQSRYYDASVGRFVNGDEASYIAWYASPLCSDLFAYCENTCINGKDSTGYVFVHTAAYTVVFAAPGLTGIPPLRDYSDSSIISIRRTVTVISCSPIGWIDSSTIMGKDMAIAMNHPGSYEVKTPSNEPLFAVCWRNAGECVIIHTHGDFKGLYDESEDYPQIASTKGIQQMPKNDSIYFVMMTACSTAGGDPYDNVAYHLSKKINSKGIVIANKYTVEGASTDFGATEDRIGWVVYRNGKIIREANQIPKKLFMKDGYEIYKELMTESSSGTPQVCCPC